MTDCPSLSTLCLGASLMLGSKISGIDAVKVALSPSLLRTAPLSVTEECSSAVFEAEGAREASMPGGDDGGNAFVGSGLSLLRERLFAFFPLSDVGLILAGGGGAVETRGACRGRSEKRTLFNTF